MINSSTYSSLIEIGLNELDWPQMGASTGYETYALGLAVFPNFMPPHTIVFSQDQLERSPRWPSQGPLPASSLAFSVLTLSLHVCVVVLSEVVGE